MPRQQPRHPYVGVKLDEDVLAEIDRMAAAVADATRSEILRLVIDRGIISIRAQGAAEAVTISRQAALRAGRAIR
jgi:metal-responsive CopG/Arc/MetJ family transcriptional regulator